MTSADDMYPAANAAAISPDEWPATADGCTPQVGWECVTSLIRLGQEGLRGDSSEEGAAVIEEPNLSRQRCRGTRGIRQKALCTFQPIGRLAWLIRMRI